MQDLDTPPAVEGGEASDGEVAVRPIVAEPQAAIANHRAEASTRPPWITAIVPP